MGTLSHFLEGLVLGAVQCGETMFHSQKHDKWYVDGVENSLGWLTFDVSQPRELSRVLPWGLPVITRELSRSPTVGYLGTST